MVLLDECPAHRFAAAPRQIQVRGVATDVVGAKRGDVLVGFGARDAKGASRYSLSIPTDSAGPLTFTRNGKGADMAFQGKTKDGISLRVTAKCAALEELLRDGDTVSFPVAADHDRGVK